MPQGINDSENVRGLSVQKARLPQKGVHTTLESADLTDGVWAWPFSAIATSGRVALPPPPPRLLSSTPPCSPHPRPTEKRKKDGGKRKRQRSARERKGTSGRSSNISVLSRLRQSAPVQSVHFTFDDRWRRPTILHQLSSQADARSASREYFVVRTTAVPLMALSAPGQLLSRTRFGEFCGLRQQPCAMQVIDGVPFVRVHILLDIFIRP